MANLLSPSSPNLITNVNQIGRVLLGYLLQNSLPQTVNLVFNHVIPQDLFQERQAELDSRDTPLNPPLIEVTSTVVKPFFDSPTVGTAKSLIQQFQEKINQSNSNNTKQLTQKTPSFEGFERKKILSDGESSSSPSIEISQLPPRESWSSFDLSSSNNSSPRFLRPPSMLEIDRGPSTPNHESFEGKQMQTSPDSLFSRRVKSSSSSPQDLQPPRNPSPLIIINEPNKENVGEVLANNGGEFVISQSGSCFAEILPTAISSQNTLPNLSSSAPNNIQTPNLPNPSPPKTLPLSTSPKAVNDKNNSSCLDEALKFFTDLIEKCCEPTKIPAKSSVASLKLPPRAH